MYKIEYHANENEIVAVLSRVVNGFILIAYDPVYSPERVPRLMVFQEREGAQGIGEPDFETVADVLWEVLEVLGVYNSKHYHKRLEIRVVDQDAE